jgi:hypothetical protein
MRRDRGLMRGRLFWILAAGFVGYLLGDWHAVAVRAPTLSPSQNVALRFPEADNGAQAATGAAGTSTGAASTAALRQAQLDLLDPQPMAPVIEPPPAVQPQSQQESQSREQTVASLPPEAVQPPAPPPAPRTVKRAEAKAPPVRTAERHAERPGFMLNDAQIASIKARLHLTPDQQRMWPAVEVALRNIAYAKERTAHHHGASPNTEVASLDPNGAEVQDLKSAAIPLIMSFNDEQKNEVRSLAHVMGLDKLASEF